MFVMNKYLKWTVSAISVVIAICLLTIAVSRLQGLQDIDSVRISVDPKVGETKKLHCSGIMDNKEATATFMIVSADIYNNSNKPVTVVPSLFFLIDITKPAAYEQDLSAAWALPHGYPLPNSVIEINPSMSKRVDLVFDVDTTELFYRNKLILRCYRGIDGKSAEQSFTVYERNVYHPYKISDF